jgi:hypothetical protein
VAYIYTGGHFTGPDAKVHTAGAKIIGVAAERHAGIIAPPPPSHNWHFPAWCLAEAAGL